jgi:two-component system cell cycle response regulator
VHPTQALPLLERLRQQFHAQPFDTPLGSFQVSASFGAAPFLPDDTLESILQRADVLLYQAKQMGRNRICMDALEPPSLP